MKANKYVRVTKIDTKVTNIEVPDGYIVEGVLMRDVLVGNRIKLWRMKNPANPEGLLGLFSSSIILSVKENVVETEHSSYKIEVVKFPKDFLKNGVKVKII